MAQRHCDVLLLASRDRHLQSMNAMLRNANRILAWTEVTIKARSGPESLYRNSIYRYVIVDMRAEGADRAEHV
jgi:hypothetical protein